MEHVSHSQVSQALRINNLNSQLVKNVANQPHQGLPGQTQKFQYNQVSVERLNGKSNFT